MDNTELDQPLFTGETDSYNNGDNKTLKKEVEKALRLYLHQLEDEPVTDLYRMVLAEVEVPMLQAVMHYTGNNQCKASTMLGLNRATLRKKLKLYHLM